MTILISTPGWPKWNWTRASLAILLMGSVLLLPASARGDEQEAPPPELFAFIDMFSTEQGEWVDPLEMEALMEMETDLREDTGGDGHEQ